MKQCSKFRLSSVTALLSGLAALAIVPFTVQGKETSPMPQFNVQATPVNREARGVSYAPIIKRAAPSVVSIYSTRTVSQRRMQMPSLDDPMFRRFFGDGDEDTPPNRGGGRNRQNHRQHPLKEQSLGSGVIVSPDGYILTANHVVEGADPDGVKVALTDAGKEYPAKIIATDPQTDVAVLKIEAQDLTAIAIADSDKLEVGDIVLAIGNPFGVGQTVTMGMVSALGRTSLGIIRGGYENFIQTDAAINQGNSGGALIDAEGRLIGINTAIFSPSGGNAGIGFAVPVNLARSVMERLIQYGKVTRGYLGVTLQPEITPEIAQDFNLPDEQGAMVTDVEANTPAAKAGLKSGDVIRELNGKKIADMPQLRLMVSQLAPGTDVNLKVLRSEVGKKPVEKIIPATLGTLHPEGAADHMNPTDRDEETNSKPDSLDGVEVTDLDAKTRSQYHIPARINGALVTEVDQDSNSAAAGVRPGDVILEISRRPVHNADDAVELSEKVKGDHISLRVWSKGQIHYLTVDNTKK